MEIIPAIHRRARPNGKASQSGPRLAFESARLGGHTGRAPRRLRNVGLPKWKHLTWRVSSIIRHRFTHALAIRSGAWRFTSRAWTALRGRGRSSDLRYPRHAGAHDAGPVGEGHPPGAPGAAVTDARSSVPSVFAVSYSEDGVAKRFSVPSGETIVGRAVSCGLVLSDASVSRQHASLTTRDVKLFVQDLGSRFGVTRKREFAYLGLGN